MAIDSKNNVLIYLSKLLEENQSNIIYQNQIDIDNLSHSDDSMRDRLKIDEDKIKGMIKSLSEVALQNNPVGKVLYEYTRDDGLHIVNKTVPFGTILIIYESRPDVTIEAAATAFKAGNKILLKGGSESLNSNLILTKLWQHSLVENGFEKEFVQYLDISREDTQSLIKDNTHNIDLIIPRGGDGLINFVTKNSSVPVIVSGRGNNFLYIDNEVDIAIATQLIINGKQRISVCNAIDKVIVNRNIDDLQSNINIFVDALKANNISAYADQETSKLSTSLIVDESDNIMYEEFLAPKIYFTLADDIEQAINTINKFSGGHSAVIATTNRDKAKQFMQEVDCAAVYHNASSRFTDGGQFGVGAEIAISTQKIHFRGPLGAQELVTNKWFVSGDGHVRYQPVSKSSCNNT